MYELTNVHIVNSLLDINDIRFDCIMGNISQKYGSVLWSEPDILGYIDEDMFPNYIKQSNSYYVPISRYEADRIVLIASRGVEFNCKLIELSRVKSIPLFLDSVSATILYHRERKEWDKGVAILHAFEHTNLQFDNHILQEGYLCLWYKLGMERAEEFVMRYIRTITPNKQLWIGNSQWYSPALHELLESLW